ncbi:hypothetical protein C450_19991 [Halococcus salifodinae DSM 8989]|uniref:Uncharacterized protein n=1 Tax=Halococcus salifodinae DSM 8989 TaxID=1227456 RepID=M0MTT1_9EURY|nr:hypothetical protein C450_19991 [Halococcus salifodinae DSM 8989]
MLSAVRLYSTTLGTMAHFFGAETLFLAAVGRVNVCSVQVNDRSVAERADTRRSTTGITILQLLHLGECPVLYRVLMDDTPIRRINFVHLD